MLTIQVILLAACLTVSAVHADVTEFTDKDEWIAAVGEFTTIGFTGFEPATIITDQYADLGVLFTDGDDIIAISETFKIDGAGLWGNGDIVLAFDSPQAWIAVDFPGDVQFDLYDGDRLLHSSQFIAGGNGNFGGVISTEWFDSVILIDPVDGYVTIDDLHFGVPVPTTLALLGLGGLLRKRRRDFP
ncbi:MAG: PEP-CTERM sorting domain-containing protein [Planctomycetota bacterium]